MFKQKTDVKQGIDNPQKGGKLDGFKRMLGRSGGHCAVAEECATKKQMSVFRPNLAQMEQMERLQAMAITYVKLFETTR